MPLTPSDIARRAGQEAKEILGAAPGAAADAAANYIKIGTPPSLIPNVGLALARQACRRYGASPSGVSGSGAAGLERVCRPYLDDIAPGNAPTLAKPFNGGQCLVRYFVNATWQSRNTDGSLGAVQNSQVTGTLGRPGAIRGIERRGGPGGWQMVLLHGTDSTFTAPESVVRSSTSVNGSFENLSITSVSRVDGQPDSCGNPAPVLVGPGVPSQPQPRVQPYNPSPAINIDIDLEVGPTGDITFNIGTGPITIDPFGDGDGDGGGSDPGIDQPGTAPSSGLPPGDIGAPAQPVDTGEDGVAAGCAPPNSVLVGIKIDILAVTGHVSEYDPLVRRGVCYAYMGTPGNLALEPSGVALRSGQMLFAPLDNLTCYEVRANVGFSLRVTPYYRALELTEV